MGTKKRAEEYLKLKRSIEDEKKALHEHDWLKIVAGFGSLLLLGLFYETGRSQAIKNSLDANINYNLREVVDKNNIKDFDLKCVDIPKVSADTLRVIFYGDATVDEARISGAVDYSAELTPEKRDLYAPIINLAEQADLTQVTTREMIDQATPYLDVEPAEELYHALVKYISTESGTWRNMENIESKNLNYAMALRDYAITKELSREQNIR